MPFDEEADLVILGAGCAGLSLASRLARADSGLTVLALDSRDGYADDRSWCFWRPDRHDLDHLVSKRWSSWTFSHADGRAATRSVPGLSYQYVRGADFYADALRTIDAAPAVTLTTGVDVASLEPAGAGIRLHTDRGSVTARWAVDTRPRREPANLYQCFSGVELESDGPLDLDLDTACLMTGMRADADGLAFTYQLPLSPRRVLVEFTRFSAVPLAESDLLAGLDRSIAERGLAGLRSLRREHGILPMGQAAAGAPEIPGVVQAGLGGGALRSASGYAFLRIQAWADACARRVASGGAPVGHPPEPWDRREMDRIFLQAIRAHPERTAEYFMALGSRVAPRRLVRFLSDRATAADYAGIIASLPLLPFLAQLPVRSYPAAIPVAASR